MEFEGSYPAECGFFCVYLLKKKQNSKSTWMTTTQVRASEGERESGADRVTHGPAAGHNGTPHPWRRRRPGFQSPSPAAAASAAPP